MYAMADIWQAANIIVIVQNKLPLQDEAVERDCMPTTMGGRLVRTAAGRTRYPNGLEHVDDDEHVDDILLHSRAAMVMNNYYY